MGFITKVIGICFLAVLIIGMIYFPELTKAAFKSMWVLSKPLALKVLEGVKMMVQKMLEAMANAGR